MRKLGIFVLIVGFLAALIGGYYFLFTSNSTDVAIEFVKPAQVFVGQSFNLGVSFSNSSDKVIKDARLSLILPADVQFVGDGSDQRVREQTIGDIGPGSINQQQFTLIATNGADSLKHIEAKLKYNTSGNSTDFEAKSAIDLPVGQSSAIVSIAAPEKVYSGENFDLTVKYQNNSDQDLTGLKLKMDYSPLFQFQKASQDPVTSNNTWDIGTLPHGASGEIKVTGNVIGPEQSFVNFNATLTSDRSGQSYTINSQTANVSISTPPLSVAVSVNGDPNYAAHIGDNLNYTLTFKNNSNTPLQNITVRAGLTGILFDPITVQSEGSFNSVANRIVWSTATTPALALLNPGDQGTVSFAVQLKKAFPISRLSDKNFTVKVDAQIESPTVPAGTVSGRTLSVASIETKVAGKIEVQTKAFYRDASSGILNTGPFPPKVNTPTRYTIHWIVKNYSTDMTGVKLTAFLQPNSRFTGKVISSIDAKPVFNADSGQVTWDVGNLPATKGILGTPLEAVFQIETTPSLVQLGQIIPLLSDTKFQGTDTFVSQTISGSSEGVFTDLKYDATVASTDKRVQP